MIDKILSEISRLKNELDGYSAREALDYIESYINTFSKSKLKNPHNSEKPNNHLEGLDEAAEDWILNHKDGEKLYVKDAFKAGAEWHDRQLNWARDLVQAGIDKPEEAVNILKRLKELI